MTALPPAAPCHFLGPVTDVLHHGDDVLLHCGEAALQLTFLDEGVVRVRLAPQGRFTARPSYAVDASQQWTGPRRVYASHEADTITFRTAHLQVRVERNPCRLSFHTAGGTRLYGDAEGAAWMQEQNGVGCFHRLQPDTVLLGLGDKATKLNRCGRRFRHWNTDAFRFMEGTDPLYKTHPFLLGLEGGRAFGVFFDNPAPTTFDLGKADAHRLHYHAETGALDYYFFHAATPLEVIQQYTRLTGLMPMQPKWALGYHQCRFSYFPESDIRQIAEELRTRKIPCDVLYFDIDYMDGYRVFKWNRDAFPDPERLISDLRDDGFRSIVIVDPGVKKEDGYFVAEEGLEKNAFCRYPDGNPFLGEVWPGICYFPDFTDPDVRAWWGDLCKTYLDQGVAGIWCDMNEPSVFTLPGSEEKASTMALDVRHHGDGHPTDHRELHNVYGQQMVRAVYEGLKKHAPTQRPFVITRAAYSGTRRWATSWTGDNTSSWKHLKLAIWQCLALNVCGESFIGSDVGGFCGTCEGELLARWTQLGAFTPLFRNHSTCDVPRQEPWLFGEEVEDACRKAIELRYALLPYFYTVLHQAAAHGLPMMRPLAVMHPRDETVLNKNPLAFYYGPDLLVCPIARPGQKRRTVYLPEGGWYDFWTGQYHEGRRTISKKTPLDELPLFVRAGAVLPLQPVMQHTDAHPVETLTLHVYPRHGVFSSELYEDAGDGWAFADGDFFHCRFQGKQAETALTLKPEVTGRFVPAWQRWQYVVHGLPETPSSVLANGASVSFRWEGKTLFFETPVAAAVAVRLGT